MSDPKEIIPGIVSFIDHSGHRRFTIKRSGQLLWEDRASPTELRAIADYLEQHPADNKSPSS